MISAIFRRNHPSVSDIAAMADKTIPEAIALHRHMRDCDGCRIGWKILTGVEWEVPKGLKKSDL